MFQAFVITLREGLEAFLIVAISLAYLKKTGRSSLIPAVHWGIAGSVVLSIIAGLLFAQANNQALWEGILALVAGVLVASLTVHMWRAGRRMKKDIEARLEASSARLGRGAFLGVLGFTLLMITREGMETALLMNTLLFSVGAPEIIGGAVAGTIVSAFIAWLWSRYGYRVNLSRFFQVTAVFLFVFVRATLHLRIPRADRGQHHRLARRVPRCHRALRARRHLRPVSDVHARHPAGCLARAVDVLRSADSGQSTPALADGVSALEPIVRHRGRIA